MITCLGAVPTVHRAFTARRARSTCTIVLSPITATYAVLDVGSTAMPRGQVPSGTRATGAAVRASMMLRSYEHQLLTSTCSPSGVTSTYFGTAPTGMTWSTTIDRVSIRYT